MAEFVPIGGSGKAGVCGASVVCGVMTCGVEVPVRLPIPSALKTNTSAKPSDDRRKMLDGYWETEADQAKREDDIE
jgi:hypothetical protein